MERAAPARARVSDAGPARLLAGVVGAAARLCGARLASIALVTEGRDHLELRSVFGTGGVIAEQRLPVPEPQRDGDHVGPQLPQPRRVARSASRRA